MAELTLTLRQEAEVVTDLARGRTPAQVAARRHLPTALVTAIADRHGKDRAAWSKASKDLNRQLRTDEPEQLEPDEVVADRLAPASLYHVQRGAETTNYGTCSFPGCGHPYVFPSSLSLADVQAAMNEHGALHPRPLRDATRAAWATELEDADEQPVDDDFDDLLPEAPPEDGVDQAIEEVPSDPVPELEVPAGAPTELEVPAGENPANNNPPEVTPEPEPVDSLTCGECGWSTVQLEDSDAAAQELQELAAEHAATHLVVDPLQDLLQAAAATGDPAIQAAGVAVERAVNDLRAAVVAYQDQVFARLRIVSEISMLDARRADLVAQLELMDGHPTPTDKPTGEESFESPAEFVPFTKPARVSHLAGVWMDLSPEVRARIRPWAIENGVDHAVTGRQPKATVEAYLAAHPEDDPR